MKLSKLIAGTGYTVRGNDGVEIKGIAYDSRNVEKGWLFFALPGHHVDGNTFVADAVKAGAAAVVTAESCETTVPCVVVPDTLEALGRMSEVFYGHPDRELLLIGVTGTNGKTTITYLLESLLGSAGKPCGVMGTVNYRYRGTVIPAPNTTPQSGDIYRILREMVKSGEKAAVMEVSSHALALGRVAGLEFDIAIFTNLTRDHLDFHKSMEEYFKAKEKLFANLGPGSKGDTKYAIINLDDPWGKKLVDSAPRASVVTYGISPEAAVRADHVRISGRGTEFILTTPQGKRKVSMPHVGQHNVYNALAAAAAALAAGLSFEEVANGLEKAPAAPGRLERVDAGQPYTVVVDYAHTDDALRNVLNALRELKPVRLITVFGCGGDRDRSKRPIMGDVATELSDFAFVTSDNPRSEDPGRIALDIEVGIRRKGRENYRVILDRAQAIAAAVHMAHKGDIILIAGKGHETYQIIGTQRNHFNDAETAGVYIEQRQSESARRSEPPQREFNF